MDITVAGATPLIGQSPAFLAMMEHVSRAAGLDRPVLVIGERGTGKELVAGRLHFLSPRWDRPFLQLNCAALAETLLESELFGHEAGSFTGASRRHRGRFERADGGSLFLDEIATASARIQEKLLRVIEYGSLERVGGQESLTVDVRLIAATNADLPALADDGRFRHDLLDRLAFDVITLPPLRARREDIAPLAEHFGIGMCRALSRPFFPGFSHAAMDRLLTHDWPGNIRELKNVVERAVTYAGNSDQPIDRVVLDPFDSPYRPAQPPQLHHPMVEKADQTTEPALGAGGDEPTSFEARVLAFERTLLREALEAERFNQKRTAERLGLGYHQFRRHLKRCGVSVT